MLFRYKINLEVEVVFNAALLGADTTCFGRNKANAIAKDALERMICTYQTSNSSIQKSIIEDNLNGKVSGNIRLETARSKR